MKFSLKIFSISAAVMLLVSAAAAAEADSKTAPVKSIKAALYVDDGSAGNGVFYWAILLKHSPGITLELLNGADIRAGKLAGMDLLVMPGGMPGQQYNAMKEEGVAQLHKFLENGGSYVGTCAGLAGTLNDQNRLRLLPFHRLPNSGGRVANIHVEINKRGAELLGIEPGRIVARYAGGPIPKPGAKAHEISTGEVLAVYKNTVSYIDKPHGNQFNQPAIIYGSFGKGKVIATGFHPECWKSTYHIAMGCIYAVTSFKSFPVVPIKSKHPYRAGYYTGGRNDIESVKAMLKLYSHDRITVKLLATQEINEGDLEQLDILVLPDASSKIYASMAKNSFIQQQIREFVKHGGKVFAAGKAQTAVPEGVQAVKVKSNEDINPDLLLKNF